MLANLMVFPRSNGLIVMILIIGMVNAVPVPQQSSETVTKGLDIPPPDNQIDQNDRNPNFDTSTGSSRSMDYFQYQTKPYENPDYAGYIPETPAVVVDYENQDTNVANNGNSDGEKK